MFFIIKEGEVEVIIDNIAKKVLGTGASIGELALLNGAGRGATIITQSLTTMWGLDRKTFRNALKQINSTNFE